MLNYDAYYGKLSDLCLDGIKNYVEHGWEPGGFLYSLLANDLVGACSRADHWNKKAIHEWAEFLYMEMPSSLWGSYEKVNAHIQKKEQERLSQVS